jgi:DUF4097 and DUF4098 domain-containing protein YvlB
MHAFETPGPVSLHVRLPAGRVVVTTTDEPRTTVELVPVGRRGREAVEDVVVTADERAGRHIVTIEQEDRIRLGPSRIALGGVEVRVACPHGTDLELSGGSTDLSAEGVLGTAKVRTASGDVRLETVSGELELKTASGDVRARRVDAGGSVVTVSGDLAVDVLAGPLTARTVSGDAEIGLVRSRLTLGTTSGDVQLHAVEGGEVRVQTVSGDARLGIARGTRVWIDAVSVSGALESELDVGAEEPASETGEPGPLVPVHVKTVSGDVAIVRASAAISA